MKTKTHVSWLHLALIAGLLLGVTGNLWPIQPVRADATILYVDKDATGANNGSSWADAYTTVKAALDYTNANGSTAYEIWVADGTYTPGSNRTDSFRIERNNVQLYGGFVGTETSRDERDWVANPTILSGDIGTVGINSDNAYHVVYVDGTTANGPITSATVIDGFTITAGNANGSSPDNSGGGLYCNGAGSGHACSPTLTNVTFSSNTVTYYGGGMYNNGLNGGTSSPTLSNVIFSGNTATYYGGGMYNYGYNGGNSSPTLTNVTFSGNSASGGGGMYNNGRVGNSSPTLTNVTFSGNTATNSGGGMYNNGYGGVSSPTLSNVTFSGNTAANYGGGMYNDGYNGVSSPTLTNVTFSGNTATDSGGGMYNYGYNGNSSPTLSNVTFSGNTAANYGGGMYFYGDGGDISATIRNGLFVSNGGNHIGYDDGNANMQPHFINCTFYGATSQAIYIAYWDSGQTPIDFTNSIFWGNNGDITNNDAAVNVQYSIVEEASYGGSNNNIHAAPLFVDATNGNLRLDFGSPAIDAGTTGCPTTDLDGLPRPADGNGDSTATCDMGAYEAGTMVCGVSASTYNFPHQSGVSIQITALGSELACLYVDEMETNHPNATTNIQTGRYWLIRGLQSDKQTNAAGFSVNLTLPTSFTPDANDKVCHYTGSGWDCAASGFGANSVTRSGITAFSDWAVGNDVGTNAVTLRRFGSGTGNHALFALGGLLLLGMVVVLTRRARR